MQTLLILAPFIVIGLLHFACSVFGDDFMLYVYIAFLLLPFLALLF